MDLLSADAVAEALYLFVAKTDVVESEPVASGVVACCYFVTHLNAYVAHCYD